MTYGPTGLRRHWGKLQPKLTISIIPFIFNPCHHSKTKLKIPLWSVATEPVLNWLAKRAEFYTKYRIIQHML